MQAEAPEAFSIESESEATRRLYGIDQEHTRAFGSQCLMARRLVERGVLFVQFFFGANGWEQHSNLRGGHSRKCAATDLPIAGLLRDFKMRGLLDETLVLWGGDFGRTTTAEGDSDGRNHHPYDFTMWIAGGGVRGGIVHGSMDEFGWSAIRDKVHVHDLHATILHLMGIDNERLTYHYAGRDYRLTDVHGRVVNEILA